MWDASVSSTNDVYLAVVYFYCQTGITVKREAMFLLLTTADLNQRLGLNAFVGRLEFSVRNSIQLSS